MTDPLEPLRNRFRSRIADDRVELARLTASDPAGADMRRLAHNLAGSAGTFGYPALGAAAAEIDDQMADGSPPDAASLDRLRQRLDEVEQPAP